MKVIQVHSNYRSWIPSGENLTVSELSHLFKRSEIPFSLIVESTDPLLKSNMRKLMKIYSVLASNKLGDFDFGKFVGDEILIIHNEFPVISLRIWKNLASRQIPILRVIHNYRSSCLSGNHWYLNRPCFECNTEQFFMGFIRKCYQGNYLTSLLKILYTRVSQRYILKSNVTFVAISRGIEDYILSTFGYDVKIFHIPNSVPEREIINSDADEVLYVSRLEEEKGLRHLLSIWKTSPKLPTLNIVGVGRLKPLAEAAAVQDPRIIVHGAKHGEDLELIARKCKVSVFPTLWNEPFGRTMIEAISRGQAIVATKSANAENCVKVGMNGYMCSVDEMNLGTAVENALALPIGTVSATSLEFYNEKYSDEKWKRNWLNAIRSVCSDDYVDD